jgi:hypothetical protein
MRALSIRQPWIHMILAHRKRVENRGWRPPADVVSRLEAIALHASGEMDHEACEQLRARGVVLPDALDCGAILGTARVMRLVTEVDHLAADQRQWFDGPIGWCLGYVWQLAAPVECRGSLYLWTVPATLARRVDRSPGRYVEAIR